MAGYIFSFVIILIITLNIITLISKVIKDIKSKNAKGGSESIAKGSEEGISKILTIGFCIVAIIISPFRVIPVLIRESVYLTLKGIKRSLRFLKIFLMIRNKQDFAYITLIEIGIVLVIITLYIYFVGNIIGETTNIIGSVLFLLWALALFTVFGLFIISVSRYKYTKGLVDNFGKLIFLATTLGIFIASTLSIFEKVKDSGIKSVVEAVMPFIFLTYVLIILMLVLKNILDSGSIFMSVTLGLGIYLATLFFITCAIGFYLTAAHPQYFKKDEIIVGGAKIEESYSYISSYSYKGAKYLLAFPSKEDFQNNRDTNNEDFIPMDIYIVYFLGLLINIVVTAFFVSYSVSIYLMRITQSEQHTRFINRKDFLDKFFVYVKERFRETQRLMLEEK